MHMILGYTIQLDHPDCCSRHLGYLQYQRHESPVPIAKNSFAWRTIGGLQYFSCQRLLGFISAINILDIWCKDMDIRYLCYLYKTIETVCLIRLMPNVTSSHFVNWAMSEKMANKHHVLGCFILHLYLQINIIIKPSVPQEKLTNVCDFRQIPNSTKITHLS